MRRTSEAGTPIPGATATFPQSDPCEDFVHAVYRHHATPLLRYAARLLNGDWHKAEDFLQEATARAWRNFTTTTDPVSIRPWLFTVVRNLAIDHHRARAVRPPESPPADDVNLPVDDAIDAILTTQVVLDALGRLTPPHREVIALVYYRGYSVAQAAQALGVPPGTVKSRSYYALRALRDTLRAKGITHP
ncbi:sigma-70 family RNA polymerase sigma factor [Streptomyces erythrochromogenes]|uniref:sigma-70 family RNA polymerase sigma factor n=1 Tax=Streptomyces erythrochromogenes TaxID=285574 RepID=UPI003690A941